MTVTSHIDIPTLSQRRSGEPSGRENSEAPVRSPTSLTSKLMRAIVGIVADHTGRGPTTVSVTVGQDVICVVMRGTHTKGERALLASGEQALVSEVRRAHHRAMRPALLEAVQAVLGRELQGALADHDPALDVSTLNFLLAPRGDAAECCSDPVATRPEHGSRDGSPLRALVRNSRIDGEPTPLRSTRGVAR